LGRQNEALMAAQQATDIYRELSSANPGAFECELASSLIFLAMRLVALGRLEQALTNAEEAIEHYRLLAQSQPELFTPDLEMSLRNRTNIVAALRRGEAH